MTGQGNNRVKLEKGRFRVDIRKNFFTMKVLRHTNWLFREVTLGLSLKSGQGFQQPDLLKDVPARGREVGLGYLQRFL